MARAAGIELFHIPFDGVTPAVASTVAGDVDLVLGFASAILPQAEGGNLVALAQLSEERTAVAPDTPTLIEGGVELALPPNTGLWAPAGTPEDVIATLSAAVEVAASSESFTTFTTSGLTAVDYADSAEFTEVLKAEDAFFAELGTDWGPWQSCSATPRAASPWPGTNMDFEEGFAPDGAAADLTGGIYLWGWSQRAPAGLPG